MQLGFLDIDTRHAKLSGYGDPLERLNQVINWEIFRPVLAKIDTKKRKSNAGRKPTDRILMFKLLILQRMNNLSDERLEFQVADRLCFMRFLGLDLGASVHDSQEFEAVLRSPQEGGADISADSAYRSDETQELLAKGGYNSRIHERAYRGAPLTDVQKASNKEKSKIRARVEHVFGHMQTSLGGMLIRSIGELRAKVNIGLMNLTYNLSRVEMLIRKKVVNITGIAMPKMA